MTQVNIKRVYDPAEDSDGYRVLVDKLWPRGVKKEELHYNLWAKDIAPSTQLREWFHDNREANWSEFREKYMAELENSTPMLDFINDIRHRHTVTLLYASRDREKNHAQILKDYISGHLK